MRGNSGYSFVFCLLLLGGPFATIAETGDTREPVSTVPERVIELHDRAIEGAGDSVDRAISALEDLLKEDPENELARAYLGNTYTLKARDAAPWRKRGWLNRGIETMDAAVDRAPGNPRVRLIRAINAYNLPRMAGRYDLAAGDFTVLLEALDESPDEFDAAFAQEVYFHAGAFAIKEADFKRAVVLLEKAGDFESENGLAHPIETMLRAARSRIENS